MAQDVAQIAAILDLARERGLRLRAIVCGDVKLVLSEPWPTPELPPNGKRDGPSDQEKLRRAGKDLFGRVMPDELLEEYRKDGLL